MTFRDYLEKKYQYGDRDYDDIRIPIRQVVKDVDEYLLNEFLEEKLKSEQKDFLYKKSINVDEGQE